MRVGTLIDYRVVLHGLPLSWRTKITVGNLLIDSSMNRLRALISAGFMNIVFRRVMENHVLRSSALCDPWWLDYQPAVRGRGRERIFKFCATKLTELFGSGSS